MNTCLSNRARWCVVAGYAAAMAWVESAVVFYLRTMVNRIEPYQPDPLPLMGGMGAAELVREAATLVMLLAVGILAGRSWRSRLGFSALAFGIWDILYYVFLKVLCGWPHSLLDWDILFLLPLPWWGPVLAPVLISVLMIIWGTLAGCESTPRRGRCAESVVWVANVCGVILALRVFMQDTLAVAKSGAEAVRHVLPLLFNWPLFCVALSMMSAPAVLAVITLFYKRVKNLDPVSVQEGVEEIPSGSRLSIVTNATVAPRPSLEG